MSGELIGLISISIGFTGAQIGIYRYFTQRIDKWSGEHDKKLSRVFERLDEHKADIESKFVRKDVCAVLHNQTASNLEGLERRLNKQLENLQNEVRGNFEKLIQILTNR